MALLGLTGCKEKAPEVIEITAENYSELDYNNLHGVRLKFLGEWTTRKFIDLGENLSESIATNVVIDMSETQAEKLVGFLMCGPVVEVIIGPGVKQVSFIKKIDTKL